MRAQGISIIAVLICAGLPESTHAFQPQPRASYSGSISQIVSGGGWKTRLTLVNLNEIESLITVQFRGGDGLALSLPIFDSQERGRQASSVSTLVRILEPRTTLIIETVAAAESPLAVGWAEVTSTRPVVGFAIFGVRGQDGRDSEGTAPLEIRSTEAFTVALPFDNAAGFATAIALVNLATEPVAIAAVIIDNDGSPLASGPVPLAGKGHTSFSLQERFPTTAGRRGVVGFINRNSGGVTALGLRFSPSGSFTSLPSLPLITDTEAR